ncbi:MAG: BON domain-containing protein [Rudaea sp.]|uniref:BON domain-containing protein n=1 Tax=unclassified Rudaea TaxID=2627037 RepID=UPI0010F7C4B2|nr:MULTISPECIES: BON domain-containing protein [unclassified Rudaea]MBN8886189.1 BON domain-containing protein [Rudaea sp.]MBQ3301189.1 BON domain-containing protein [Eggerthellaceae bacterium]MBR0346472.1 BON domain-containing protein [Rudaea sp.]
MSKYAAILGSCLLAATLSACSTYQAYRKCGFGGCPGDEQIAAQVNEALLNTPGISYWTIDVQSLDHVVYLHGLVDTNPERAKVEEIAFQASGGKKIVDSIELRNATRY